jgi:hypothetical protein
LERLTPLAMRDERRFRERKDRDVGCPQGDSSLRSSTY